MAHYIVSLVCYLEEPIGASRTIELGADLDFITQKLHNQDFMKTYLQEQLKVKVFSYGIREYRCVDVHVMEKKLEAVEKITVRMHEKIEKLTKKLEELTTKGKEKVEEVAVEESKTGSKIEELTKQYSD